MTSSAKTPHPSQQVPTPHYVLLLMTITALAVLPSCHRKTKETKKPDQSGGAGKQQTDGADNQRSKTRPARWVRRWIDNSCGSVGGVAGKGTGKWIFACGKNLWTVAARTGQHLSKVESTNGKAAALAVSGDGRLAAIGGSRGQVSLVDLDKGTVKALAPMSDWVTGLAFDPKAKLLAAVDQKGQIKLYDTATAAERKQVGSPDGTSFYNVAFHPNGKLLAVGGLHKLLIYDFSKGAFVKTLPMKGSAVESVAFGPKGKKLAAASNAIVQVFDTGTWNVVATIDGARAPVAYDPKGKWMAFGTKDKEVEIRDAAGKAKVAAFKTEAPPWALAFSADGSKLAVAQRFDAQFHVYSHDGGPDISFSVRDVSWYGDDSTVSVTLSVIGPAAANTTAYGKLKDLKATDGKGNKLGPITSSINLIEGMKTRNRSFAGTSRYGFQFPVRIKGIKPSTKKIGLLEGTITMRVAKKSGDVVIGSLPAILGKPIVHPTLKKLGISVTAAKVGDTLRVSYEGAAGQVESVALVDNAGKAHALSQTTIGGGTPFWETAYEAEKVAKWKLRIRLIPKLKVIERHFGIRDIVLPPKEH